MSFFKQVVETTLIPVCCFAAVYLVYSLIDFIVFSDYGEEMLMILCGFLASRKLREI